MYKCSAKNMMGVYVKLVKLVESEGDKKDNIKCTYGVNVR